MIDFPLQLFEKYDIPVPRYTSYPTALQFYNLKSTEYEKKLRILDQNKEKISIYIHIPFCRSMCLFCACSVILNRNEARQQNYVEHILKEIELYQNFLHLKHDIVQLHFGGGTPTNLTEKQFSLIIAKLKDVFDFSEEIEMSIEIDPRNVLKDSGKKLHFLKKMGFNRVSLGLQDTNLAVQEVVKRRQSYQMSKQAFSWARQLQFDGVNVDLIYGLPLQTLATFQETVQDVLNLKPDRIALFSYAKVPWIKLHQKAIKDELLPKQEEKFEIYKYARKTFVENGYQPIGMDHFALKSDLLAKAFFNKSLDRNFQGYSLKLADNMLGFGVSSIGYLKRGYFQNIKDLESYQRNIACKQFPVNKGYLLNKQDLIRKWVIKKLMCNFEINKQEFKKCFKIVFDDFFQEKQKQIILLQEEGFINFDEQYIKVTRIGELFIRVIASIFDEYYECSLNQYSKSV